MLELQETFRTSLEELQKTSETGISDTGSVRALHAPPLKRLTPLKKLCTAGTFGLGSFQHFLPLLCTKFVEIRTRFGP